MRALSPLTAGLFLFLATVGSGATVFPRVQIPCVPQLTLSGAHLSDGPDFIFHALYARMQESSRPAPLLTAQVDFVDAWARLHSFIRMGREHSPLELARRFEAGYRPGIFDGLDDGPAPRTMVWEMFDGGLRPETQARLDALHTSLNAHAATILDIRRIPYRRTTVYGTRGRSAPALQILRAPTVAPELSRYIDDLSAGNAAGSRLTYSAGGLAFTDLQGTGGAEAAFSPPNRAVLAPHVFLVDLLPGFSLIHEGVHAQTATALLLGIEAPYGGFYHKDIREQRLLRPYERGFSFDEVITQARDIAYFARVLETSRDSMQTYEAWDRLRASWRVGAELARKLRDLMRIAADFAAELEPVFPATARPATHNDLAVIEANPGTSGAHLGAMFQDMGTFDEAGVRQPRYVLHWAVFPARDESILQPVFLKGNSVIERRVRALARERGSLATGLDDNERRALFALLQPRVRTHTALLLQDLEAMLRHYDAADALRARYEELSRETPEQSPLSRAARESYEALLAELQRPYSVVARHYR